MRRSMGPRRAGRSLFDPIDWPEVVRNLQEPSIGDWIRLMHGALRRKARRESTGEEAGLVSTEDLIPLKAITRRIGLAVVIDIQWNAEIGRLFVRAVVLRPDNNDVVQGIVSERG